MENRFFLYSFCLLMLFLNSCSDRKAIKMETPFVTVVKLISAEQCLDLEEAMLYMDVVQVYSKLGSKSPIEDWKKFKRFQYNLGKDKKFSNVFKYCDYDIEEVITDNNASVHFTDKDVNSLIKKISYGLEKRNNQWIVVSIDYLK